MAGPPDNDLMAWIDEQHVRARSGKLDRFRVLLHTPDLIPSPPLAYEYFEEARLCWLNGAFVATIVMVQLAFEELLRDRYRVVKGFGGKLNLRTTVDRAGFKELVRQAKCDSLVEPKEAAALLQLRNVRNPYVHSKIPRKAYVSTLDYVFAHRHKFVPKRGRIKVEEEARKAIQLLLGLFSRLCYRWLGEAMKPVAPGKQEREATS
jgi:hypothetical protein